MKPSTLLYVSPVSKMVTIAIFMASEHQPGGTGDQFLAPSGLPRLARMFLRETQLMGSLKRAFTGVHDRVLVGVESPRYCTSPFS